MWRFSWNLVQMWRSRHVVTTCFWVRLGKTLGLKTWQGLGFQVLSRFGLGTTHIHWDVQIFIKMWYAISHMNEARSRAACHMCMSLRHGTCASVMSCEDLFIYDKERETHSDNGMITNLHTERIRGDITPSRRTYEWGVSRANQWFWTSLSVSHVQISHVEHVQGVSPQTELWEWDRVSPQTERRATVAKACPLGSLDWEEWAVIASRGVRGYGPQCRCWATGVSQGRDYLHTTWGCSHTLLANYSQARRQEIFRLYVQAWLSWSEWGNVDP